MILVVLCAILALTLHPLQSTATPVPAAPSPTSSAVPTATATDAPLTFPTAPSTAVPVASPTPPTTATATVAPVRAGATYRPGDAITIVWPYKNQVWDSAYWDQASGGMFNELPGPGNRCSTAVSGPASPLTTVCSIPANATPGYHTITLAEFYNYNGGTIAGQRLRILVVDTAAPTATPTIGEA